MSQLFEMCQAIVNFPKSEMTLDNILESMNGKAVNPHSIRCALSKIASNRVLVEPTRRYRGRAKIYKKRKDIGDQWDWMMAHKSPADRLILPDTATVVRSRKSSAKEPAGPGKLHGNSKAESIAIGRLAKELSRIGEALEAIESAIHDNTEALQAMAMGKPTVVIRKERA